MNIYFILIAGTAGMCLLAGSIITFTVVYRKRLAEQQVRMAESEVRHQRELLHNALTAQEKERKRLASDLHDEVGAVLAALRLSLSQAEQEPEAGKVQKRLLETKHLVDVVSASARRISHDLMPPVLETFGLPAALEDLAATAKIAGLQITADLPAGTGTGNNMSDLALYRIVQELCANTLKHAQATRLELKLYQNSSHTHLYFADNGKGMGENNKRGKGIGLKNIEGRLSMINGTLEYHKDVPGVALTIHVPKTRSDGK